MKLIEAAENIQQAGFSQRIEHLVSPPFRLHDSDILQHCQVIGNRRHVEAKSRRQVGDAPLTFGHRIHNNETMGVAERFKNLRRPFEVPSGGTRRYFTFACHTLNICQIPN